MAPPAHALPRRTIPRLAAIVERSRPNPDRPRLSKEIEDKLEPVEARTAACFAGMEELAYRYRQAALEIDLEEDEEG